MNTGVLRRGRGDESGDGQALRGGTGTAIARWRAKGFEGVELHRGSMADQELPRHWHDEFYVCAVVNGTAYLEASNGTRLLTPPGTLAVVGAGEVHANRKMNCSFRCMFVEMAALRNCVEEYAERSIAALDFRSCLIEDAAATQAFLEAHQALEAEREAELGRDGALLGFLYELAARHSAARVSNERDGNEDGAVRRTQQFLEEHCAERIALKELARLAGLSAFHLNRSFCRKVGMPPHAYQVQVRIKRAKKLMQAGRSISETATLLGFVDQSHLTRHFKRSTGVTPGEFLR